jgi:molybdenum cofactor guanylyltransferase
MTIRATHATGAIILAGGRATRMNGLDKPLQKLGGKPLLAHVIAALAPQCSTLVINANGDAARFSSFDLPVVADANANFLGPLAGVLAGLDDLVQRDPALGFAVSVATDTPFLPTDLVVKLHAARASAQADIAVARSGHIVHPTFALWPVAIRDGLRRALIDEDIRRVTSFLARHTCAYADWDIVPSDPFFNVNTPDDLREAERILAEQEKLSRRAGPEK